MVFLWWQSVAEGYDYAVVIMIVISNHCWMESECVISAAQTAPEWLSALDGSNGGRFETQAFCWHKHWQMHAAFLQADNLTFSAGGSNGRWGSWITSTAFQRGAACGLIFNMSEKLWVLFFFILRCDHFLKWQEIMNKLHLWSLVIYDLDYWAYIISLIQLAAAQTSRGYNIDTLACLRIQSNISAHL